MRLVVAVLGMSIPVAPKTIGEAESERPLRLGPRVVAQEVCQEEEHTWFGMS